jgi:hypothetical protein
MAAALAVLASLLSSASSLKSLFQSAPSFSDMIKLIVAEVKAVFFSELASAEIRAVAGAAQAAHDFLAIDYVNLQAGGASKAQLWALLNSADAVSLNDLRTVANTIEQWASDAAKQDGPKSIVRQSISLSVTVYTLLCMMYREFAAVAPDDETSASFEQDMRDYAAKAVAEVTPLLTATLSAHQDAVAISEANGIGILHDFGGVFALVDNWYSDDLMAAVFDPGEFHQADRAAARSTMNDAELLYRTLLSFGTADPRYAAMVSNFLSTPAPSNWHNGPYMFLLDKFQQTYLPRANVFANWYADLTSSLKSLQRLSATPTLRALLA